MLAELHVTNLGVIGEARLDFGPGMHVLTGETGAGKTLVVEALGLVTGGRADASMVGPNAPEALVEASFTGSELPEWLGEEGDELVISRTISVGGRNRAYVNGRLATASQLHAATAHLLAIHGQNSASRLIVPGEQLEVLDGFGGDGVAVALAAYRREFARMRSATERVEALGSDPRERAREIDLLEFQIRELEAAALEPGEDNSLSDEAAILESAAQLREEAESGRVAAHEAADLLARLGSVPGVPDARLAELSRRSESLSVDARDMADELRVYLDSLQQSPQRLAEVRDRLDLINSVKRKYGTTVDEVRGFHASARDRLAQLQSDGEAGSAAEAELEAAREAANVAAAALSAARSASAEQFGRSVEGHLGALALEGASFSARVTRRSDKSDSNILGPSGSDAVTFLFSANSGIEARSLAKVASGGELSRLMLAIELVAAGDAAPQTMVFDEIDAGVGGETAATVADRLAELGDDRQVICVTHLAQVASRGERHFKVEKSGGVARITSLTRAERTIEVGGMLAGEGESEHARSHAEELLDGAERERHERRARRKKRAGSHPRGSDGGGEARASISSRG